MINRIPLPAAFTLTVALAWTAQAPAQSGSSVPEIGGVYVNISPAEAKSGGPIQRKGPPSRPTSSSPLGDGSLGRPPGSPELTPEYMAKWEMIRKSRMAASPEYDNSAKCLPIGMPAMMASARFGNRMEVIQTKDKILFYSENNDSLRRIYLDGRKPSQRVFDDPTYAGYSTGHWEGDTMVVDTVAMRDNTFIDAGFSPHSDAITVHERIRPIAANMLEDKLVVTDAKALAKPWEVTYIFFKLKVGADEVREAVCPEGMADAK